MIAPSHIDAQGNVTLWEKTDDGARQVKLSAIDAVHALSVDPDRWSLDEPKPKPKAKREKKPKAETGEPAGNGDATEGDEE